MLAAGDALAAMLQTYKQLEKAAVWCNHPQERDPRRKPATRLLHGTSQSTYHPVSNNPMDTETATRYECRHLTDAPILRATHEIYQKR